MIAGVMMMGRQEATIKAPTTAEEMYAWFGQVSERFNGFTDRLEEGSHKFEILTTNVSTLQTDVAVIKQSLEHIDECVDATRDASNKTRSMVERLLNHGTRRNRKEWPAWARAVTAVYIEFKPLVWLLALGAAYMVTRHVFGVPIEVIKDYLKTVL